MNTNRLETFADGVFAIAATLLILNVDAQVPEGTRDLEALLLHIWPSYAAYAVTFFTIGIVWVNHHTVMSQIDRADRVFLFLNIGFLMLVAFAPFPTRLIAEHIRGEGARAGDAHLRHHSGSHGRLVRRTVALRLGRSAAAPCGPRPQGREGNHQKLSTRTGDVSGRDADLDRQPNRRGNPLRGDRSLLHPGEFTVRPNQAAKLMSSQLAAVTDTILRLHGFAALAIVFLIPALEASAFVGFVFPGEIAVLLGGVLAYQGRVPLWAAIIAAVLGAAIGDSIGYAIGKRWGRSLLHGTLGRLPIIRRGLDKHLDRAQEYIHRRGPQAVFVGRFTAAFRVLVPGLAGMAGVSYRSFVTFNVLGAIIWGTGFALLGFFAGAAWQRDAGIAGC